MSKLNITEQSGKIENAYFAYIKLKNPVNKYKSDDKEYCLDVVVDKATAKEMKKIFIKNKVKEVDNEDFEDQYKFAPPFPDQDEQFILKFKSDSHYKDGTEKPYHYNNRPKVFIPVENGVEDVTMTTRVGNGSMGDVAFSVVENDYGTMHRLFGILVKDMVELQNSAPPNPFGQVVNHVGPENQEDDSDEVPDFFDE